jgi:hypothetical protein
MSKWQNNEIKVNLRPGKNKAASSSGTINKKEPL